MQKCPMYHFVKIPWYKRWLGILPKGMSYFDLSTGEVREVERLCDPRNCKYGEVRPGKNCFIAKGMGENSLAFNILFETDRDQGIIIAHCLELDIVDTNSDFDFIQLEQDIKDLIIAQVKNAGPEYLYHPAPPEVWRRFYRLALRGSFEPGEYSKTWILDLKELKDYEKGEAS